MSSYHDCKTCGAFSVSVLHHRCPPKWLVLDKDGYGDDWEEAYGVRAHDAEDAASAAAEQMDNGGDGPMERSVYVRLAPDGEIEGPFAITFDYSIDYYAHRATSGEGTAP